MCTAPFSSQARAALDGETWGGLGVGFALWTSGSGAGFNVRGEGGYNITKIFGVGLHTDYSRLGTVGIKMINYGGFVQVQEPTSSLYGRIYFDGITAIADGNTSSSGISNSQTAFAPGLGSGILIPVGSDLKMSPQIDYKVGLFSESVVHIVQGTFNLVFDF